MKALFNTFVLLLATLALASCGGGGGGSQGAFSPTPADTITISAASNSVFTNSFTTVTVSVNKHDGSIENDGTTVNASLSPSTIGTVSGKAGTPAGTTASNTLSGGKTTFNFSSSNQAGTANITFSVPAGTNGATTAATASVSIAVASGGGQDPRLQLTPSSLTLPLNPFAALAEVGPAFVSNYPGSPFIGEVTVTWRHSNGQLVNGTSTVNVAVSPTNLIGFSQLDNPATQQSDLTKPDGNEFLTILGSGPVNVTAGIGTIFVHADNVPGTATLTVTAIDPDNNQTITSTIPVTIAGVASNLPASISITSQGVAYVADSNGPQNALIVAAVTDGNQVPAADPDGFDNVQFTITGPANSDAHLTGLNAAGQPVSGTTINTVTHNGIATISFVAGSQQGPVQVRAIADRGDNNVDNGIQDPVTATTTLVVSDGQLYTLTLTEPNSNAITVNSVSGQASGTSTGDPNASYSLVVSAMATDREGNPVVPGTVVKFGSIDAPQSNGAFSISGTKGNPQEGGTFFNATDGQFKTAGGGAGPGDTLIVFGKDVPGNADLESASKVTSVNNQVSLNVATPFNLNDTTGTSVDNGYVLPYVIGRAQTGNISSPAFTDAIGIATTTLNYPVAALGRAVAIWAQGDGTDTVTGGQKTITDAALLKFPGVAPATITVSPNPIPGNLTVEVDACIVDALQNPISGVRFNFAFQNLGIGIGKLDGIRDAGVVPDVTDANGCVATTVNTTGIDAATQGKLVFTAGAATGSANIVAAGSLVLLARPSSLGGEGGNVTLTLLNSNGTPVAGVQLVGTCTGDASIGIKSGPGVTDANGQTTVTIQANLDDVGGGRSGSCTFTTTSGSPSATVTLQGVDVCLASPHPTTCPDTGSTFNLTVSLQSGSTGAYGSVSSAPAGLSCAMTSDSVPASCAAAFSSDTSVVLSAALSGTATGVTWTGSCAAAGNALSATVSLSTNKSCGVTFTAPAAP